MLYSDVYFALHDLDHSISILMPFFHVDMGYPIPVCQHSRFTGAKMMEVVVTTGALRCAKLQSNRHHHRSNQFFYRPYAIGAGTIRLVGARAPKISDSGSTGHNRIYGAPVKKN